MTLETNIYSNNRDLANKISEQTGIVTDELWIDVQGDEADGIFTTSIRLHATGLTRWSNKKIQLSLIKVIFNLL